MQNNPDFEYDPPCGNGIDEELYDNVVDVLAHQHCDEKGSDYYLYDNSDISQLQVDKWNKTRYDVHEGFDGSSCSMNGWFYWFLVILLIVLLYMIYYKK
jgi:hypothetical protein